MEDAEAFDVGCILPSLLSVRSCTISALGDLWL